MIQKNDVDPTKPIIHETSLAPTTEESIVALKQMKGFKAPGTIGIPADALKALNKIGLQKLQDKDYQDIQQK